MAHVTCHVSHVKCHMLHVTSIFNLILFVDILLELVGGGPVINGATPSSFYREWIKSVCQEQKKKSPKHWHFFINFIDVHYMHLHN